MSKGVFGPQWVQDARAREEERLRREPWPAVIWAVRYSGAYEGGKWAAATCGDVPDGDHDASDPECAAWWGELRANGGRIPGGPIYVAVGDTPQDAWEALLALVRAAA